MREPFRSLCNLKHQSDRCTGFLLNIFCGNPHFCSIEMQKQHGSGPKAAPADAFSLFVSAKVRHQFQFRKLFVGDAAQLVQDTVGQFPQLGFVRLQMPTHVTQILHQTGAGSGIVDAHQIDLVKRKAIHVTTSFDCAGYAVPAFDRRFR